MKFFNLGYPLILSMKKKEPARKGKRGPIPGVKRGPYKGLTIEKIGKALTVNYGLIGETAKALNCSKDLIRYRINESEKLQDLVKELSDALDELATGKMIALLEKGDPQTVRWYMGCRVPGYSSKQEIRASVTVQDAPSLEDFYNNLKPVDVEDDPNIVRT